MFVLPGALGGRKGLLSAVIQTAHFCCTSPIGLGDSHRVELLRLWFNLEGMREG